MGKQSDKKTEFIFNLQILTSALLHTQTFNYTIVRSFVASRPPDIIQSLNNNCVKRSFKFS